MTQPATILPKSARDRLASEARSIARAYKSQIDRRAALDHAIATLKRDYPEAFRHDPMAMEP